MSKDPELPELIHGGGLLTEAAYSYVPRGHEGACAMSYRGRDGQHWVIFPSRREAITAAAGACRRDVGGYSDVTIHPVTAAPAGTHHFEDAVGWLFGEEEFWEEKGEPSGVGVVTRNFMRELARQIAARPEELRGVEWRDLERLLFEVFAALGYRAKLTRPSRDGGYDIELEADGLVYFVEVKHWSEPSKVGAGIIDRFTDLVVSESAEGLLLSSSGFTDRVAKARLLVSKCPVVLGTAKKVISLCRCFIQSEAGIWTPRGGLRDVLFEDTLWS